MASLRAAGRYWHIRFQDKHREPREVVVSLHKGDYTEKQARQKLRDLEADVRAGRFDPWAPASAAAADTLWAVVEGYIEHKTTASARFAGRITPAIEGTRRDACEP